jgi:hypothetical protein
MTVHSIAVARYENGYRADCTCGWDGPKRVSIGSFVGHRHGGDPYKEACADAYAHLGRARDEGEATYSSGVAGCLTASRHVGSQQEGGNG